MPSPMTKGTGGRWQFPYTVNGILTNSNIGTLQTQNKFVDADIDIYLTVPEAGTATLNLTDKTNDNLTMGTATEGVYHPKISLSGGVTYATAGWVNTSGSSGLIDNNVAIGTVNQSLLKIGETTVSSGDHITAGAEPITVNITEGYNAARNIVINIATEGIASGTITNNISSLPSGSSSSGTINRGKYIKIGAGYYATDAYYLAQANSGTLNITTSHKAQTSISVDGYKNINITGITVPKTKAFAIITEANTSADSNILTVTNKAYRTTDITNAANGTVLISNNAGNITTTQSAKTGTIKVNAYDTSSSSALAGEKTIVENGAWKTTTITTKPSSATTYYGRVYVNLNTTSVTQTNTTINDTTVTRGTASWGTGWISSGSISAATFANTATSGKTYVDISDTSAAPVLTNGVLYINKGYVDDISISLGQLIPDTITDKTYAPAEYIRSGYAAYGADGSIIAGTMPDTTPTVIATPSNTTYFTEQSSSSGASFSITPSYTNGTAGYLTKHTTAQNGKVKYYKIISASFTGNGGNVTLNTDTSQTNSIYRTGSESYISVESSAPDEDTNFVYVKVTGSGTAKPNKAGWITLTEPTATGSSIKYIKIAKYTGDYTTT